MYGYANMSRCHVMIHIFMYHMVKCIYKWHVQEHIYMDIYMCGFVCKHMVVVMHV